MNITKVLRKISFTPAKVSVSMDDLITYPKESLGFHLGCFLFNNSHEPDPIPEKEDIYRLLLTKERSSKEEIAMHYYLFGNGDNSLRTLFIVATGAVFYLHCIKYFYSKYRDGRNAFKFYYLDHFKMLHLPLEKIKDAFMIRYGYENN